MHRSYDPALDSLERSWCCGRIAHCCFVTTGTLRRGLAYATVGGLCGLLAYIIPASMFSKAGCAPRIHDITIDTQNPPRFIDIVAVQNGGAAKEGLDRYSTARRRNAGAADLRHNPGGRFRSRLANCRVPSWEGRIEPTDSSFWFGFTDDIVIKITALAGRSRIDIRSVSRVGRSDVGANAARIRRFITAMKLKRGPQSPV